MPGDRKSVQDAAPGRDPNLTFTFGEAFERLVEELQKPDRKEDEFTAKEFCERLGLTKSGGSDKLNRLVKEGRVERRKVGLYTYYRVKE